MNKNERPFQMKRKGAAVGLVICFVVVIAFAGMVTFRNYENKLDEQIAKAKEEQQKLEETAQVNAEEIELPVAEEHEDSENEEDTLEEIPQAADENESASTENITFAAFSEDSLLDWPASGNGIMQFSMDQTTYFSTLDQYKYNPAMIVGGMEGEGIYAAAAGTVKSIDELAQTGVTVTLDMGNGYEAVYGQLKDVPVSVGDYLSKGTLLGYLDQPTKYYSLEGTNLYFEMKKDGLPVNPMNYME